MGVDRKNYVMSAEVAMAREMAYKNKLQVLSKESVSSCITGTTKDLLHSQVPTPTPGLMQNQRPGVPPGSMAPPFPQAHTSLSRIWSPTILADQVSVPTPTWRPINLAAEKRKGPVNHDQSAQLGSFFCLLCQIDCTTSYNLMMHYQGQRHMAKLLGDPRGKKAGSVSALSTAKDRLYCKLCGIWCKDEFTFRLHLHCKNHILTLHEYEKKMKKPRN